MSIDYLERSTWLPLSGVFVVTSLFASCLVRSIHGIDTGPQRSSADSANSSLRFLTEPESIMVWNNFNGTVTLHCVVHPPDAVIRWSINGTDDTSGHVVEPRSIHLTPKVGQSWSEPGMLGSGDRVYRCLATSSFIGTIMSREAVVSLARLQPFSQDIRSVNITVLNGSVAVLKCSTANGNPQPVIEFEKNGRRLKLGERQRVLPSGTLQIVRVSAKDAGVYRCAAVNPVSGERYGAPDIWHLKVISHAHRGTFQDWSVLNEIIQFHQPLTCYSKATTPVPSGPPVSPQFLASPGPFVRALAGSDVTLECAADGWPIPRISWIRQNKIGNDAMRHHLSVFGNRVISDVRSSDEGIYECHASNSAGNHTSMTQLIVNEPPTITIPLTDQTVTEGSSVSLRCDSTGSPVPLVKWFHNGVLVSISESRKISGFELLLSNVQSIASGMYQCFVTNDVSTASSTARLVVNKKPTTITIQPTSRPTTESGQWKNFAPGDEPTRSQRPRVRTSSTIPSTPTKAVVGLSDVTEQPISSDDGPFTGGFQVVDLTAVMEPPPQPEVSQLSDTSALIQWTGVLSNGSLPVTFYKIQYHEVVPTGGGSDRRKVRWITLDEDIPSTRLRFEVNNLKAGSTYRFRLAAIFSNNQHLMGPVSHRLSLEPSVVDRRQRGPIGSVTIVELIASSNVSMQIRWQYETGDRAPVEGFLVLYKPYIEGEDQQEYKAYTVPGPRVRHAEVTGLTPGTAYSFRMQSYNDAGQSEMSSAVVKKTAGGVLEYSDDDLLPISSRIPLSSTVRVNSVYIPNRLNTHASNELLIVLLAIVLGSTVVTLIGIMLACACQQRRRNRILAARRGETKFHDPARSIYLNTLSKTKSPNSGNGGGFLLKNLDSGQGNRLARNGSQQQDPLYSSGRWSSTIGTRTTSECNEPESKVCVEQTASWKSHKCIVEGSRTALAVAAGDVGYQPFSGANKHSANIEVDNEDFGLIQRPRDMAPSSSSSSQQLTSLRSAVKPLGGGCSDAGSRQSSSLNRDRQGSPDHIPRLHECWSLEPVRRANNRGGPSSRSGATELSSELSSLDSLPVGGVGQPSRDSDDLVLGKANLEMKTDRDDNVSSGKSNDRSQRADEVKPGDGGLEKSPRDLSKETALTSSERSESVPLDDIPVALRDDSKEDEVFSSVEGDSLLNEDEHHVT